MIVKMENGNNFGKMVINMKVILKMAKEKEREYFIIIMEIDMKGIMEKIERKVKELNIITMVINMMGIGN